jgi:hypothetical protein
MCNAKAPILENPICFMGYVPDIRHMICRRKTDTNPISDISNLAVDMLSSVLNFYHIVFFTKSALTETCITICALQNSVFDRVAEKSSSWVPECCNSAHGMMVERRGRERWRQEGGHASNQASRNTINHAGRGRPPTAACMRCD